MSEKVLSGQTAIVTGGSRGIGEGIVRVLAAEGAVPVIISNDLEEGERVAKSLGDSSGASAIHAELTRPDDCRLAVEEVLRRYGRIDGLVNNAGVNDGQTDRITKYGEVLELMAPPLSTSRLVAFTVTVPAVFAKK